MNKFILLFLTFVTGYLCGRYFLPPDTAPKHPNLIMDSAEQSSTEVNNAKAVRQVMAYKEFDLAPKQLSTEPSEEADNLKSQVSLLQQQLLKAQSKLELQKQQIQQLQSKQSLGFDHQKEIERRLAQQSRDTAWAYEVETAMADFFIVADLPIKPNLVVSECLQSICQFELELPNDSEAPKYYWRNIYDQLMTNSWWQQFKYTSSTTLNNGQGIRYILSKEPIN